MKKIVFFILAAVIIVSTVTLTLSAQSSSEEKAYIATQLYENFLKAPVELFCWTDAGIMRSTWMGSEAELDYVRDLTVELTKNCETIDDKIYTVAKYIAQNVCYDYDYYRGLTTNVPPYDPCSVLQKGYAVCSGYAKTYEAMLQSIGIPCVYVSAPNHAWNLVYNGERWMLIDTTWMSASSKNNGELCKAELVNMKWYDFTFEDALKENKHVIDGLPLYMVDGELTDYPDYSELPYIYWPDGVEVVTGELFSDMDYIEKLELPKTLRVIGERVFSGFSNITEVEIPEGVTTIGDYAFRWCSNLADVKLPDSLETIGDEAFRMCYALKNMDIPDGVTSIGEYAFYDCTALDSIDLPKSLTSLKNHAFYGCRSLKSIEIPGGIKTIEYDLFDGCSGLTDVKIGEGITRIEDMAFLGCTSLTEITMPKSFTSMSRDVFKRCGNLTSIIFKGDAPTFWAYNAVPTYITLYYYEGTAGWTSPTWTAPCMYTYIYNTVALKPEIVQVLGDLDENGVVDVDDVLACLDLAFVTPTEEQLKLADLDSNGVVDVDDVLICLDLCFAS